MARYIVEIEHTPEDCVAALDSVVAMSKELIGRFDWGCKAGAHTGWAVMEARDEATARMLLPTVARQSAKVVQLNKFTVEDVQSFHTGH
ncbi:MAG TPA: hypothetical protein VJB57_06725 [Dehalococcoidia bacterium]|nr:hypothetical protein [Dehalococcoidia bacterium]